MMTNLFSIFDPSSSIFSQPYNWSSALMGLLILPVFFWLGPSRPQSLILSITNLLSKELTMLLGSKKKLTLLLPLGVFLFIILNNCLGLLPFIFTASSHLLFTLPLALPLWLGYFLYSWIRNTTNTLGHLVPQGTPPLLMPFMVIVESLSNIIRPFTLAIRLAANMIAGHLLLTLMSNTISILSPISSIFIILLQILLMLLEMAVAMIQAYVFMTLSALYISEV